MKKLSTAAAALALAVAANVAFADDNSMSRFGGESYAAFEAAHAAGRGASAPERKLIAADDNGMSRFNGDSYAAFEQVRTAPTAVASSIKEANRAIAAANRQVPARAVRGPVPVNAFSDATG